MQVSCIDNIHQFDGLRSAWDAVYAADPHTTVFTSWSWLRGWVEFAPGDWVVLAIRPETASSYVAFFTVFNDDRGRLYRGTLQIGGDRWADHTGFVCLPEHEEEVIVTLATFVQRRLQWDRFCVRNFFDPRLDLFLSCFSPRKFGVRQLDSVSCPYIPLPDSWNQYLQEFLGSSTRKNLRYYTRRIERLDDFRITYVDADNLDSQIETLLELWQSRWGPKSEPVLDHFRVTFRRCFESKCLWLAIMWAGTVPIVGLAALVDRQGKTFSYWIGGYDDEFSKLSPGTVMVGHSVRYAIEDGFQVYDFLRGDESYKFSFGAVERFNFNYMITRRSVRLALSDLIGLLRGPFLA